MKKLLFIFSIFILIISCESDDSAENPTTANSRFNIVSCPNNLNNPNPFDIDIGGFDSSNQLPCPVNINPDFSLTGPFCFNETTRRTLNTEFSPIRRVNPVSETLVLTQEFPFVLVDEVTTIPPSTSLFSEISMEEANEIYQFFACTVSDALASLPNLPDGEAYRVRTNPFLDIISNTNAGNVVIRGNYSIYRIILP